MNYSLCLQWGCKVMGRQMWFLSGALHTNLSSLSQVTEFHLHGPAQPSPPSHRDLRRDPRDSTKEQWLKVCVYSSDVSKI